MTKSIDITASFDVQFARRNPVQSPAGILHVVDVCPPDAHSLPILFAPGWHEIPELQRSCTRELYQRQRRVVTFAHALRVAEMPATSTQAYPIVELQKAKALIQVLDSLCIRRADVLTHSEGAINTVIAALERPDLFGSILLITPAGLAGTHNRLRLVARFLCHSMYDVKTLWLALSGRHPNDLYKELSPKGLKMIYHEINALSSFDLSRHLVAVRKKGIRIGVLAAQEDTVFRHKHTARHATRVDLYETMPGGHGIYSRPQPVISQALTMLAKLRKA